MCVQVFYKSTLFFQVIGFLFLIFGMDLYNNLITMPLYRKWKEGRQMKEQPTPNIEEERQRLLGTLNNCKL